MTQDQLTLFSTSPPVTTEPDPPVGAHHPSTSFDAAERVKPHAATQRQRIHEYLCACGASGATDEQIANALGLSGNTVRPRRGELAAQGRVVWTGQHRPTHSGCRARVWEAQE